MFYSVILYIHSSEPSTHAGLLHCDVPRVRRLKTGLMAIGSAVTSEILTYQNAGNAESTRSQSQVRGYNVITNMPVTVFLLLE